MTESETVALLVGLLERQEPFLHVRFGDGDVFFLTGTGPNLTADGEEWSERLSHQLRGAWEDVADSGHRVLLGDLLTYDVSDGCEEQWARILADYRRIAAADQPTLVHIEALRAGRGHALPVYAALALDERSKVFVGPERLHGAAEMLHADHLVVPLRTAHEHAPDLADEVSASNYEVAIFAAGRGGKIVQGRLAGHRFLTQIDVGSGLDLLFTDLRRGTDGGADVDALREEYRRAGLDL